MEGTGKDAGTGKEEGSNEDYPDFVKGGRERGCLKSEDEDSRKRREIERGRERERT